MPKNIEDKKILLCDPMLATGGTLLKAIEEVKFKIIFCWYIILNNILLALKGKY